MAQLDIAGIDPKRIEHVVTHRLVEIPTLPKVLALPFFGAAAAAHYAGLAPLWMVLAPAAIYVISVWGSWQVQVVYRRDPSAVSLAAPCRIAACAPKRNHSMPAPFSASPRSPSSSATGEGIGRAIEARAQRQMIPHVGLPLRVAGKALANFAEP